MDCVRKVIGKVRGLDTNVYIMTNDNGMEVAVTELGGQVLSIKVPDKNGKLDDITLHYQDFSDVKDNPLFFGVVVARNANRIANAKFSIDGEEFNLENNDNGNNLHSGNDYFHNKLCLSQRGKGIDFVYAEFSYNFKHLEQGFPGEADFRVRYILGNDNSLRINYTMISSRKTIFNPTSHIYWNLAGHKSLNIMDHELKINASKFTPINDVLIPEGLESVIGTPLDFYTKPKCIRDGINDTHEQIKRAGGFDHNFAIEGFDGTEKLAAEVYEPTSGRVMQVYTNLEGIQFYSGNFIKDYFVGKDNVHYDYRAGFCLETQHFPNAVNDKNYISPVIDANVEVTTSTMYKFSTR